MNSNKKNYLGADHAGYELKEEIKKYLTKAKIDFEDLGNTVYDKDDDYPDYIFPVAKKIAENPENYRGIIIGGSGQGEAMTANRIKGVRAVVFYGPVIAQQSVDVDGRKSADPYEIIRLSRLHNDSNVLSLSSRFLSTAEALEAVQIWLKTEFENDERHLRRIKKIDQ
jgi:ribose 5-phosphate isomerase B